MLRFFIAGCFFAVVCGQTKYCCSPEQWEVNEGELSMYVEAGIAHLVQGRIVISYDFTHQRIAFEEHLTNNGVSQHVHVIMDFKNKVLYVIVDSVCSVSLIDEGAVTYHCVPDAAEWRGSYYYGSGAHTLLVDTYRIVNGSETIFMEMSQDHCIPVTEAIHGTNPEGQVYLQTNDYVNTILGVREAQVFTPPSTCQSTGKRSASNYQMIEYLKRKYSFGGNPLFNIVL